jgi:hypothetical protein
MNSLRFSHPSGLSPTTSSSANAGFLQGIFLTKCPEHLPFEICTLCDALRFGT